MLLRYVRLLASAALATLLATTFAQAQQKVAVADDYDVTVDPSVTGTYVFAHGFGLIYAPMAITRETPRRRRILR